MKTLKSVIAESREDIMKNTTIEELYKWAVKNKCADYEIRIQYRDDAGDFFGCDDEMYLTINRKDKTIKL